LFVTSLFLLLRRAYAVVVLVFKLLGCGALLFRPVFRFSVLSVSGFIIFIQPHPKKKPKKNKKTITPDFALPSDVLLPS